MKIASHSILLLIPSALAVMANPGERIWTYETGELIFGAASLIHEDTLFFTTEVTDGESQSGQVYALDISTHLPTLRWTFTSEDWIDASPALSPDGSTLYVGSWDGNFYALNAETGAREWTFQTDGIIIASAAVGSDGTIYVPSNDGFFYALNPDGTEQWNTFVGAEIDSSPSIDLDGSLYFGTYDGRLVALNADGSLKWEYTVAEVDGLDNRILTSPAISLQGEVIFGSGNGFVYSLRASNGALEWNSEFVEEMDSSPAVDTDGNVYVATRAGFFYKLDNQGIEQWSATVGDVFFSSALIDDKGLIYIVSFAGNNTSTVLSFDPDGNEMWSHELPAIVDASLNLGPDGTLYIGAFDGTMYAIEAGFGLAQDGWPKFRRSLDLCGDLGATTTLEGFFGDYPEGLDLGSDWAFVNWLGLVYTLEDPWHYHLPAGWLYQGGPGVSEYWWYSANLGWLWTTPSTYPYVYRNSTASWIYFSEDESGMFWYYDFNSATWNQGAL